jgi:hypothetical protein
MRVVRLASLLCHEKHCYIPITCLCACSNVVPAVYVHVDAVRVPFHAVFLAELVGFVRQVPAFSSEIWTLGEADERTLGLLDRRILRSLFCVVQVKWQWRRWWDFELCKLYDQPDLAKCMKISIMHWAGYIVRMVMSGQLRECLASSQREREELEDLKWNEVCIRLSGERTWRVWRWVQRLKEAFE